LGGVIVIVKFPESVLPSELIAYRPVIVATQVFTTSFWVGETDGGTVWV